MKYIAWITILLLFCTCSNTPKSNQTPGEEQVLATNDSNGAEIPTIDFAGLQQYMEKQTSQLVIYNLWATWCRPCVAELPAFTKLADEYAERGVKVVLVSLDFPDQKGRLEEFVTKRGLKPTILHLDEPEQDKMINGISPEWSGAIPATLLVTAQGQEFKEQGFTYEELQAWVEQKL